MGCGCGEWGVMLKVFFFSSRIRHTISPGDWSSDVCSSDLIGQGIEFDYCCCHASFAARELGLESIMVNSNPETVSTDYDTSDLLFFEPLTLEDVLNIHDRLKPWGTIVQFGGQTPLKLAAGLEKAGVRIIGTSPESIDLAEDREEFAKVLDSVGLRQAPNGMARNLEEALAVTKVVRSEER